MGGMLSATLLSVLFVPVFYVVVRRCSRAANASASCMRTRSMRSGGGQS